jgi:hypothetical protein
MAIVSILSKYTSLRSVLSSDMRTRNNINRCYKGQKDNRMWIINPLHIKFYWVNHLITGNLLE